MYKTETYIQNVCILMFGWLFYIQPASCYIKKWLEIKNGIFWQAGMQELKGLFFIVTFKWKEILETEAESIKDICVRKNIFEYIVTESYPLDMMNVDRLYIKGHIKLLYQGNYNVLVLRNLYDISGKKKGQENFINLMQKNRIVVYLVEGGIFIFNNYEER